MHIDPDWSTIITTFTGKPVGSGICVQTRPEMARRLSTLMSRTFLFSREASLQPTATSAARSEAGRALKTTSEQMVPARMKSRARLQRASPRQQIADGGLHFGMN